MILILLAFQAYANKTGGSNGDDDTSSNFELARIEQAKMIMKPFMLRRLKRDVIKQLPPKKEMIIKCQMNQAQRECYNEIKLTLVKKLKVILLVLNIIMIEYKNGTKSSIHHFLHSRHIISGNSPVWRTVEAQKRSLEYSQELFSRIFQSM